MVGCGRRHCSVALPPLQLLPLFSTLFYLIFILLLLHPHKHRRFYFHPNPVFHHT
jgi:hypothetical protein